MDLTPMLIGGSWRPAAGAGRTEDVTSLYDGSVVGTVPVAGATTSRLPSRPPKPVPFAGAHTGARADANPAPRGPARRRASRRHRADHQRRGRQDDHRGDERGVAVRGDHPLAAFEGTQLYGDTLPLDANPGTGPDKIGFTLRPPCGIVVAISPSTIRRCSFCTRSHRRWPRATRSCSSRQGRRR